MEQIEHEFDRTGLRSVSDMLRDPSVSTEDLLIAAMSEQPFQAREIRKAAALLLQYGNEGNQ